MKKLTNLVTTKIKDYYGAIKKKIRDLTGELFLFLCFFIVIGSFALTRLFEDAIWLGGTILGVFCVFAVVKSFSTYERNQNLYLIFISAILFALGTILAIIGSALYFFNGCYYCDYCGIYENSGYIHFVLTGVSLAFIGLTFYSYIVTKIERQND